MKRPLISKLRTSKHIVLCVVREIKLSPVIDAQSFSEKIGFLYS